MTSLRVSARNVWKGGSKNGGGSSPRRKQFRVSNLSAQKWPILLLKLQQNLQYIIIFFANKGGGIPCGAERGVPDPQDPLGWDIFNVVNFKFFIYMKLYRLLILTKNTKKSKNNFKAPKKSEIVVFPGRILPCKQNKSAILSTLHHIFPRIRR